MLQRKGIVIILVMALLSTTYILAVDHYSEYPRKLEWLKDKISQDEKISWVEVGSVFNGIAYDKACSQEELEGREGAMLNALSHEDTCSRLCLTEHIPVAETTFRQDDKSQKVEAMGKLDHSYYKLTIKEQKDIHYNTYYTLALMGDGEDEHLDNWRAHAIDLFKKWKLSPKETIYFKGQRQGKLLKKERKALAGKILMALKACENSSYQDDLNEETCAYYGYTPYIEAYYMTMSGYKTNTQVSFNYNELKDCTEIIVAFPFYNGVF